VLAMYGLLLRALQGYVVATFGLATWVRSVTRSGQPSPEFEPLMPYGRDAVDAVLGALSAELVRPVDAVLEDVGTWIVANPRYSAIRRLLRFGGSGFADFLLSIEELPDRARLALHDLALPPISLASPAPGSFLLSCPEGGRDLRHVLIGVIRSMADDYGALVVIEPAGDSGISIHLAEAAHGEARRFALTEAV
jgi:hypothetical protein